jgi:hypothetical protein
MDLIQGGAGFQACPSRVYLNHEGAKVTKASERAAHEVSGSVETEKGFVTGNHRDEGSLGASSKVFDG